MLFAVLLSCSLVLLVGGAALPSPSARQVLDPDPPVIVQVIGDAANGFEIHYSDGTGLFPPTDSESMTECDEYDRVVDRVRCRAEVRTWYRDLAEMQRTIGYYRERVARLRTALSAAR